MNTVTCLAMILLILFGCYDLKGMNEFPLLKGPYLGQKPPGMAAEIFAPGIVSTSDHEAFYPFMFNGRVIIFDRWSSAKNKTAKFITYITESKDGKWTKPSITGFAYQPCDDNLAIVPDENTLYFASNRSRDGKDVPANGFNIWIVKKTVAGFSNPRMLQPPVNYNDIYPSVSSDGTIYFFSERQGGLGHADIYRSKFVNEKYTDVENLGEPVNTENPEIDPFIAPDQSYLVYCSKTLDGYGGYDLFITFRMGDGSWTAPVNMGQKINSSAYD